MKYLKYFLLLLVISCGGVQKRASVENTTYQTSGVEQFFLAELPRWANFSTNGKCFKTNSFHYLDFPRVAEAYQLDYSLLVELQAQYNDKLENYFKTATARFLRPVEEASFFSNSLEQVRGGIRKLKIPENVKEIDIVWLEGFVSKGKLLELQQLAQTNRFGENLPILFSSCYSNAELISWVKDNYLENVGFYLLSSEWLTPYKSDLKLRPGLYLELDKIFKPEIKINMVTPSGAFPEELIMKGEF